MDNFGHRETRYPQRRVGQGEDGDEGRKSSVTSASMARGDSRGPEAVATGGSRQSTDPKVVPLP